MLRYLLAVLLLALPGCGDAAADDARLEVVATTTMLGDLVRNVAGDAAAVEVLLPVGVDPHDYQPSARQVAALAGADLVVANGLDLEEGLADVLGSSDARVLELAAQLDPLPFGDGTSDPHVWLDPVRMAQAARLVGAALEAVQPGEDWAGRAEDYAAELLAADRQIAEMLEAVPAEARKLVTSHDALGYFADRYGLDVVGVVVPGGSTLAEPSSQDLADLVATIRGENVTAIFVESTEPAVLAEAVAAEVGRDIAIVELYTGSLGEPGSGAETLIGMLLVNAERIAESLG